MNSPARRRYIDWARGIAVLVMLEAHTLDAWLRTSERSTQAYRNLGTLAGFAAPMFLWLAGLALVLSAERAVRRTNNRSEAASAICKRGLEIFILAFLFRLQAFVVTPGGPAVTLFRVDILNVMGPALVVAGLMWAAVPNPTALTVAYALAAAAVSVVTPFIRAAQWVGALPTWVQWYLRPAGEYTTFTLFPWCGFVLAGAALGVLIARAGAVPFDRRLHVAIGLAGLSIGGIGFYGANLPSIYPGPQYGSATPSYFAVRVGVMMLALSALYVAELVLNRWQVRLGPLERLGSSSLFVYWIHVELVYGYASGPLRRNLSLWEAAAAWVVFSCLMYGAVLVRDRAVESWRRWRLTSAV